MSSQMEEQRVREVRVGGAVQESGTAARVLGGVALRMSRSFGWSAAVSMAVWGGAASAQATQAACEAALSLTYPDVVVLSAERSSEPVPLCKVKGRVGNNIHFSVWLPDAWNGRFVMGGAGGFVAPEDNQAIRFTEGDVLRRGYATASTDTGHHAPLGRSSAWGLNNYEAIVDYAHLGMHRAVVTSKALIADFYGRPLERSLFVGCSNGGRQALHEAQRYPEDFDGIFAGAPALHLSRVPALALQLTEKLYPNAEDLSNSILDLEDRAHLRGELLQACDELDGVKDGFLHDPTVCDFDPSSLLCASDTGAQACLSREEVEAVELIYNGPTNSEGSLGQGYPFGAEDVQENGWGMWLTGGVTQGVPSAAYAFGIGIMRNFVEHDATWSYEGYDWDRFDEDVAPLTAILDPTDPDLGAFRAGGGKILMMHGWSDAALTAHATIDYVESVLAHDGDAAEDVRLFMVPGMLHCAGGPGPTRVDWLGALEAWVDGGAAPDRLVAEYPGKAGERPLCAWPARAVYQGGDPDALVSYRCVTAEREKH